MSVRVRYYREQAGRSRALAVQTEEPDIRQKLLEVAEEYDRLALEEEMRLKQ